MISISRRHSNTGLYLITTLTARIWTTPPTRSPMWSPSQPQRFGERGAHAYNAKAHLAAFVIGLLSAKRDALVGNGGGATVGADANWKNGGPCSGVVRLGMGMSCKTSKGVLAGREKRAGLSGTRLHGIFWSDPLTDTYEPGEGAGACAKRGMKLPSKQDFISMRRAFELESDPGPHGITWTKDGRAEFHRVFVDAKRRVFWSSTKADGGTNSWGFVALDGLLVAGPRIADQWVVCISR
jgi:hypothetical protein